MNPAEIVISKFGGVRPLARALKIDHSSVSRWAMTKDKRGSDGMVPSKYQAQLLRLAEDRGIDLSASELIFGTIRTHKE